jgi:hypothetical protein
MTQFMKIAAIVCMIVLSVYGTPYAQDDDGGDQGDSGGGISDESSAADVSDAGDAQVEVSDTRDAGDAQAEVSDTRDMVDAQVEEGDGARAATDEGHEVVETSESYEERQSDMISSKNARAVRPAVIGVAAGTGTGTIVRGASTGLFKNTKISDVLAGNKVRVGMTKEDLVTQIGYPPDGTIGQGALFSGFVQSKATAAGKEESWTYQIGKTVEGMRSVTFKIVDGKVIAWNEWLDTGRK